MEWHIFQPLYRALLLLKVYYSSYKRRTKSPPFFPFLFDKRDEIPSRRFVVETELNHFVERRCWKVHRL